MIDTKREIKFRMWNKGKMIWWNEKDELDVGRFMLSDLPKMQYTGLKDKNGKEIYEGDIVKCPVQPEAEDYLHLEANGRGFVIREISIPEVLMEGLPDDCEILGNIYETPELRK